MWFIRGAEKEFLIDTGMNEKELSKRKLFEIGDPRILLRRIGVEQEKVKDLIVTHLHGDHFSSFELYPNATFYVQRRDIEFFSNANLKNKGLFFGASNIDEVIRLINEGRVQIVDGDKKIAPGLSVFLVGGHTPGCQAIAIETSKGRAIICGDACPLYENMEQNIPPGININLVDAYSSLEKINKMASSEGILIPGHDPLLLQRFPMVVDGIIKIG